MTTPRNRKKAEDDSYPPNLAYRIITALDEGKTGSLKTAFAHINTVRNENALRRLNFELSVLAAPAPGLITVGLAVLVWGNPYRSDKGHAWRCGDCPWTGTGYTEQGAVKAAEQHAAEHTEGRPAVIRIRPGNSLRARARVWFASLGKNAV